MTRSSVGIDISTIINIMGDNYYFGVEEKKRRKKIII